MDRSQFVADQREIVLDAIRLIQPTFVPIYTAPPILYINGLLHGLNKHIVPITQNIKNVCRKNVLKNNKVTYLIFL